MVSFFTVRVIPRYEHAAKKLLASHAEFREVHYVARDILSVDPYNQTRRYHIKNLRVSATGTASIVCRLGDGVFAMTFLIGMSFFSIAVCVARIPIVRF